MNVLDQPRKEERKIPIMMIPVYEYFRSAMKALQPTINDFLFKPLNLRMVMLTPNKLAIRPLAQGKLPPAPERVQVSIQSQTAVIDRVVVFFQQRIASFCQRHQIHPVNVSVCLREALANAIIHGNLEVPSALKEASWEEFEALLREREALPEFARRRVTIRCQMTLEKLCLDIEDQGRGFNFANFRHAQVESLSAGNALSKTGRGLFIITAFMDAVFWNDFGNCITMIKSFQRA